MNKEKAAEFLAISPSDLEQKLKDMGLTETDLKDDQIFRFSDFRNAVSDKPIASVRKAFRELRAGSTTEESDDRMSELKALGIKTTIGTVTMSLLLKLYQPADPNDAVTQELKRRFGDKPVIAFKPGTTEVAIEETIGYLVDVEQGMPETLVLMVGTTLVRLVPVGHIPDQTFDEDPMFPGKPLRGDRSIVNHRNWAGIQLKTRQFIRILIERGDLRTENVTDVIHVMKIVLSDHPDAICDIYPEAQLEFTDKMKSGDLPKLKLQPNRPSSTRKNTPFGNRTH